MMMIALIVRFASDRVVEAGEAKAEAWSLAIALACEKLDAPAPTRRPVLNGAGSVRTRVRVGIGAYRDCHPCDLGSEPK
jgi:hypothetical protein